MSTDVLLSCWVCSQEDRNHCRKAGVNVPLLQRQRSLKLQNQGRWYLQGNKDIIIKTPNWPVTFHSLGHPTPLAGTSPGPHRLSSVSQTAQTEEQPPHTPFESIRNLFLLQCSCWHKSASPLGVRGAGSSEPPTREAHSGQVESEWLSGRIYASPHLCRLSVAPTPVWFWRFEHDPPSFLPSLPSSPQSQGQPSQGHWKLITGTLNSFVIFEMLKAEA